MFEIETISSQGKPLETSLL